MAAFPASAVAAAGGSVTTTATATMAGGLNVLMTFQGYSKLKEARHGGAIKSDTFRAGGRSWFIKFRPSDEDDEEEDKVTVYLYLHDDGGEVTARYELSLLNSDGGIISSIQSFYTFPGTRNEYVDMCELNASPLLGDNFQVRCHLTVVIGEAAPVAPPDLHWHLGGLLASKFGGDVTFHVAGELFTAHKYILAARSPVFMADLFGGPAGKDIIKTLTYVRIDGIEPRVFRALLHFIYTDTLPEVVNDGNGDDKVAMAQGLLVAADQYGMERLKMICGDVLCNHIDARTVMALLQLADNHGCRRLKEACIRTITDLLTKGTAP